MNDSNVAVRIENQNAGVSFQQMERAATAMAASGFFGVKSKDEALSLMLIAQSEGLHFATAAKDYHIISGRPALKADAMLARFQRAGGKVRWITLTDQEVSAEFSHPQGGSVVISWDNDRVTQAGLKNPMHGKFPRQMKRARVISEGVRTVYPSGTVGTYTVEEAQDIAYEEAGRVQVAAIEHQAPVGKAEEVAGTGLTDSQIEDHTTAIKDAADADGLRTAFSTAWRHAGEAKDEASRNYFKALYEEQKLARGIA